MTPKEGYPIRPRGVLRFPVPAYVPFLALDLPSQTIFAERKISLDKEIAPEVSLQKLDMTSTKAAQKQPQENSTMTLSLKNLTKNGKAAIYTGAVQPIRLSLSVFPDKTAPQTIEVPEGIFTGARVAKAKLTKEERAALPKPTLAQKAEKARLRAEKLAQELAAAEAAGEQL